MYRDIWYKIHKNIDLSVPIIKRKDVYSEINKVVIFLNQLENCNYFFSCGTALGLVREGRLLDWDTDVDIDIIEPNELIIDSLFKQMKESGYSFYRVLKKNNRYSQIVFIKEPYHSIDFCFWYKENDSFINDVPETYIFKRSHPSIIYNEFKEIKIRNIDYRIPSNTDKYFELLYGPNWKTPKKYKLWFENAHDLKIDFSIFRVVSKLLWKLKFTRKTIN